MTTQLMVCSTMAQQWQQIQRRLRERQAAIITEIRSYPPPIPACDAQFNYLLEQRTAIRQELRRAELLAQENHSQTDPGQTLADFVEASSFLK